MKKPRTPVESDLQMLTKERQILTQNRLVPRVSVAQDLLTILESPLRKTVEHLLGELAVLVSMADARKGAVTDVERRGSGEPPIPSFQSAWAESRLKQVDTLLWMEGESLSAWVNRPSDPRYRDEKSKARVLCQRKSCDLFKVYQPKYVRAGRESWVEMAFCNGKLKDTEGVVCGHRLVNV